MADAPRIAFAAFGTPTKGVLVVFMNGELRLGAATSKLLGRNHDLVARAASAEKFTGKLGAVLDFLAPAGLQAERLIVIGSGTQTPDFVKLGGIVMGKISPRAAEADILLDLPTGAMKPDQAADFALGLGLRAYAFERYKTKRKEDGERRGKLRLKLGVADVPASRKAWGRREALCGGVVLARDLVNEPANVLHPEEFARRAAGLKKLGVAVEVLNEAALKKLGMRMLLAVGQGSARESRVVVMRLNRGKSGAAPVAFVGKGVCVRTGGLSIKPAASMEDMKGDMAGAACVGGPMRALAAPKAPVKPLGALGPAANTPDGKAP